MPRKKSAAQLDREVQEALSHCPDCARPFDPASRHHARDPGVNRFLIPACCAGDYQTANPAWKPTRSVHATKKAGGTSKKTKKVGGHRVTIWDYKTLGGARFAAYYDDLPASVVGRGETESDAIADLNRVADAYGKRRRDEIEREDWAQHEAEKEEALRRGDY
jgi:hypothetical protein